MIHAMIFDLDGTLVNTEYLKALSYAKALDQLSDGAIEQEEAVEAFKVVVGRSRKEVCQYLTQRFSLLPVSANQTLTGEDGGESDDWKKLAEVRGAVYEEMLATPGLILENQWPHCMALLDEAASASCKVGLATMSSRETAEHILDILGVRDHFDCILTVDDIEHTKPNPEIYLKSADLLGVTPTKCLVIEDSPAGVKAGVSAGMHVIAMSTPFTIDGLMNMQGFDKKWLVTDPDDLPCAVDNLLEHLGGSHETPHGWCKFKAYSPLN